MRSGEEALKVKTHFVQRYWQRNKHATTGRENGGETKEIVTSSDRGSNR